MSDTLREVGPDEQEQARALGLLAFGGDPAAPPRSTPPGMRLGAFDGRGRLVGSARVAPYEQWWGGRSVPMGGVAGVAVHPDARGRGLASRLVGGLDELMRGQGQHVSALFPTAVELYRRLGWEVVGSLDETRLDPASLDPVSLDPASLAVAPSGEVTVRAAERTDLPALAGLYNALGAASNGLLVRRGPGFPRGAEALLESSVAALAVDPGGTAVGYASYDRGRGYGPHAELRVWELVAATGPATAALLRSLASWRSVVGTVQWRGPTGELALQLAGPVPPPYAREPWMLRLVDPVQAVAGRGFPDGVSLQVGIEVAGVGWDLSVQDGRGVLEPAVRRGLPALDARGLALLYAGALDSGGLVRAGLLDRPEQRLDAAFAGPRPQILDGF